MFREKTAATRQYKLGMNKDEVRHKREENVTELRKNKREEQLQKRRGRSEAPSVAIQSTGAQLPELSAYCQGLLGSDASKYLDCMKRIRALLSVDINPPIDAVIHAGIVPRVVQFLQHPEAVLQFEAAWTLTNIASGTSAHTNAVVDAGAVPVLVELLKSRNFEVIEQAVWALGNIAGDCTRLRDMLLSAQIIPNLLGLLSPNTPLTVLRNIAWTISNLCRGKPQPALDVLRPALPHLAALLRCQDEEVVIDAAWAVSYIADDNSARGDRITAVIQSGVVGRLVELISSGRTEVKTPALRAIGNIVTGSDIQTQAVLEHPVMPALISLLNHTKPGIRKEACWTISNITAGNDRQIQHVVDSGAVPRLVKMVQTETFEVAREASWALANASSGSTDAQIRAMVDQGMVDAITFMLSHSDAKILQVALTALENVLRVGKALGEKTDGDNPYCDRLEEIGGLDRLESLQEHDNPLVYQKAQSILTSFFDSETEENAVTEPAANGNQFVFGTSNSTGFSFGSAPSFQF